MVPSEDYILLNQNFPTKAEPMQQENYFTYRDLTITADLGNGSFGFVVLGHLHQDNRYVAVRKIPNILGKEENVRGTLKFSQNETSFLPFQYWREYMKFARLSHPRLIKYFAYFTSGKYFNIAMEYASEGSLRDEIVLRRTNNHFWKNDEILCLIVDMLIAVDYLHGQGFVHRNIKPSNFLFQKGTYRLKLADVGISDIMDQ